MGKEADGIAVGVCPLKFETLVSYSKYENLDKSIEAYQRHCGLRRSLTDAGEAIRKIKYESQEWVNFTVKQRDIIFNGN